MKNFSASSRDGQRKTSAENEKKESSADRTAGEAVSSAVSQDASVGAAPVTPAALQAAINVPATPTKSAETKIDIQKTDMTSKNNAEASTNAQPGSGSAAKAAGTSQSNGDESGSQFDRVRFVQRVEKAFASIGDRGGSVRLKLSPPELGSVRMEISVSKGVMRARVEAETPEAKNLLLENLPALRDRLAQQNINIQKFDVNLRDSSSDGMSQQTAGQADTGSREGGYRAPRPQVQELSSASAAASGTAPLSDHSGQLNVIV